MFTNDGFGQLDFLIEETEMSEKSYTGTLEERIEEKVFKEFFPL